MRQLSKLLTTVLIATTIFMLSINFSYAQAADYLAAAAVSPSPIGGLNSADILCNGGDGVYTELGCVPINSTTSIATTLAKMGIGVGGFIALSILAVASYQFMTSQGDPRRLQAAKELFFSAIAGIILLILSGFALKLIGVNVLGLF